VFTGGLVLLGTLGAVGTIVASGGALAAAITGAVLAEGLGSAWELLARFIGVQHARYIEEQLKHGGLLLWFVV